MRYNFTVAAMVSVLLAVTAVVQDVSGKWLFVGVAVVTVALDTLVRPDGPRLVSRRRSRGGAAQAPLNFSATSRSSRTD